MNHFNTLKARYQGFEVTKVTPLPELRSTLRELVHIQTGAHVMHIENDDPENVFCLSFQTLPATSNGVAHILEHVVLCGSEKFPIKDPFFAMSRRSLNTFMNALTGSDFTCYPAASQIPKDFYNLLEVYLDAVFHPNIKELSFKQEGHRLEFEKPEDSTTPLTIRGIVFNEMKGSMNSAASRMHELLNQTLFPNLTYGINSGGDPKEIPSLTHQELLDFHKTYYHPSRCLFYFYGNMPLEAHLDFIESRILNQYAKAAALPLIPAQPRYLAPKKVLGSYPISADEPLFNKTMIGFGWLTCHILEQEICLALSILEVILLDTDASPLKKALLRSGLCKQVSAYIDTDISEVPFTILVKGCNSENADAIETVLFDELHRLHKEGLPEEAMENAIHQLEFHRSEISEDSYPFGLTLFMRSGLVEQHGGRAERGLLTHSLIAEIRQKNHENPTYFQDLIETYLLKNSHFVRVVLQPDPELESREISEEKAHLISLEQTLSTEQKQKIVNDAAALKNFQLEQEQEDEEVLPKVTLKDVPQKARHLQLAEEQEGNLKIFHHDCFTNEIGYADIFFDLPPLSQEELFYVRLMTILLPQMGTLSKTYEELLHYIQANTGGLYAFLTLHLQAHDHNQFSPSFAVRGKALHRKLRKLFPLMQELITSADFSNKARLHEVIQKHYTSLESSFNQGALRYAVNLSSSALNLPSYVANLWYGLDYFYKMRTIATHFDSQVDELIATLANLKHKIFITTQPDLVISSDFESYQTLKQHHFYGLSGIPFQASAPWNCTLPLPVVEPQARIIASPVASIGKVFNTVSYTHPDAPALNLAAPLFDNLTLHKKIRETGGAYGGGAVCNALSGNFYFYSYRDPNIVSTLTAFESAIDNILAGQFDAQDLEEAKMEMLQDMDSPIAPGSRAEIAYSWLRDGKTLKTRQEYRDRLLGTTCEDVIAAVQRHIIPNFASGATVIFANKDLIDKENSLLEALGRPSFKAIPIHS